MGITVQLSCTVRSQKLILIVLYNVIFLRLVESNFRFVVFVFCFCFSWSVDCLKAIFVSLFLCFVSVSRGASTD